MMRICSYIVNTVTDLKKALLPKMPARLPSGPRYIVRIRFRYQRLDFLGPRRQFRRQLFLLLRLSVSKILRLPDILFQVIQLLVPIFKKTDKLPVLITYARAGCSVAMAHHLVAIVGIVPESK